MQLDLLGQFQTCPLNDLAHFLIGETEPPVMLFLAQGFQLVRSKIHDQQAPARPQDPATLSHRQRGIIEIVQHLVHSHQIRSPLFERKSADIRMTHGAIAKPGILQIGARDVEHGMIDVDTDAALDAIREEFEHTPGANPDVDHQIERPLAGKLTHLALDFII